MTTPLCDIVSVVHRISKKERLREEGEFFRPVARKRGGSFKRIPGKAGRLAREKNVLYWT